MALYKLVLTLTLYDHNIEQIQMYYYYDDYYYYSYYYYY